MASSTRSSIDQNDFLQLIRNAKGGCSDSLEELIRECQPYLLAIANAEIDADLAAKVGASDLVQNSMLSAQRCIGNFEGESREELLAWLRGILLNDLKQTHRYYRVAKRHVGREQPLEDDRIGSVSATPVDRVESPSTALSGREQEQLLYHAMGALREEERKVIELRNWQRLTFTQIGVEMNRSANAVRKLWSRAVIRLQEVMDGEHE